jgi:hypothetical protein
VRALENELYGDINQFGVGLEQDDSQSTVNALQNNVYDAAEPYDDTDLYGDASVLRGAFAEDLYGSLRGSRALFARPSLAKVNADGEERVHNPVYDDDGENLYASMGDVYLDQAEDLFGDGHSNGSGSGGSGSALLAHTQYMDISPTTEPMDAVYLPGSTAYIEVGPGTLPKPASSSPSLERSESPSDYMSITLKNRDDHPGDDYLHVSPEDSFGFPQAPHARARGSSEEAFGFPHTEPVSKPSEETFGFGYEYASLPLPSTKSGMAKEENFGFKTLPPPSTKTRDGSLGLGSGLGRTSGGAKGKSAPPQKAAGRR